MDGTFFYAVTACYQSHDAADVAADIGDIRRGETVLYVSSDELFLSYVDDLQIIDVVSFKIMLGARGGAVQIILQHRRNFYPDKQSLVRITHLISPFPFKYHMSAKPQNDRSIIMPIMSTALANPTTDFRIDIALSYFGK
jgi:hypothetical protein